MGTMEGNELNSAGWGGRTGTGFEWMGGWGFKDGLPQWLKPDLYFVLLAARLKSCPDASRGSA